MRSAWLLTLLPAAALVSLAATQAPPYDLLIDNASIIDGSGQPARRGDIAIAGRRIAAIGQIPASQARARIDVSGLTVAPGLIDVHTHADRLADTPHADNFVRMGVTTVIAGNCGSSALDIGEALAQLERIGASVNFATLIGHNTVREAVMGVENRTPSAAEMAKMRSLVWRGLADGAIGFSTGLQYVPGIYARPPEIIDLARIAANAGAVYASHMRNEGTALEAAIDETLRVGFTTGARVQISHLKVDSPSHWGASARALAQIDSARARGIQVAADQYAYTAASSTLAIRFPGWVLEGGPPSMAARLNDPPQWVTIKSEIMSLLAGRGLSDLAFATVASYGADPSLNGLSMKQVAARLKGSDSPDAQLEAAREMMLGGGASMVYHFMSDADVETIMRHPLVGFASDSAVLTSGQGTPHPRGYGNTARVLGEYVRKRGVIRLEEAIRKMTSLPATHFRLDGRGLIKEGFAADLVIFDPAAVRDLASFEAPHAFPQGIPYLLVNGVLVVSKGRHTRATPGDVIAPSLAVRKAVLAPAPATHHSSSAR